MDGLRDWLEDEPTGFRVVRLMLIFSIGGLIYAYLMVFIMSVLGLLDVAAKSNDSGSVSAWSLIYILNAAALEEIIFRWFFLSFAIYLLRNFRGIMITAVVSSLLFGIAHGHLYNLAIQGVIGFFWCLLFLKCGGLERKFIKAAAVTTVTHALYNTIPDVLFWLL